MRVLVTRRIPEAGFQRLREAGLPWVGGDDEEPPSREALMQDVDGILSLLTERIDAEVMDAAPRLRVIANMAVGYDNIDVAEATRRGILVCNTPGVLTETTADFAWALLMATARRVVEGDRLTRSGGFRAWGPLMLLGRDLWGSTLGIVGYGRIGQAVARRATGFGMEVLHTSPSSPASVPLEELLERSDFISLHCRLDSTTRHLIGSDELRRMRASAILVNTARGPVVDEAALVQALREGRIAGAGLDVYEREPELAPGLTDLENVVLAPHIASASHRTRDLMATMAADGLVAVLRGERPAHLVNPEALAR